MASKHREQKVMEAVDCPYCGAKRGELCVVNRRTNVDGRPVLHTERRDAWRAWRDRSESDQPRE